MKTNTRNIRSQISPREGVDTSELQPGLPDWTFLGPNLQNLDHFNHVWTQKKLFGPFELKVVDLFTILINKTL